MIDNILSLIIWIPLPALVLILLLPNSMNQAFRWITLAATGLQFALSLMLFLHFDANQSGFNTYQFQESVPWINFDLGSLGFFSANYELGVDGFNISLVLLAGLVMFIGAISSLTIKEKPKGYFSLYLLLSSSVVGCFVALDLLLFYIFFEFMLLPMFFLIGIWGGKRREYASVKFFLYTLLGSVLILVVIIALYISTGTQVSNEMVVHSFNIPKMISGDHLISGSILSAENNLQILGLSPRLWAFLLLFIGFAIKLPAVPLHTWLPDAHVEAPTPISVVLAGVLLKIGGYGLIRIGYSIFPDAAIHFAYLIAFVGVLSIIYGGYNALAQKDLKKLIAYSSVSHMGFVLLGLASLTEEGVNGASYQMFSHGIISPMLFIVVGVLYDRTHNRLIENYSGLASRMPNYVIFVVISFFASLGLPGFSGFIGEILVFLGAFASQSQNGLIPYWLVIVSTLGLLITAAYYLWGLQRMFFGPFHVKIKEWESSLTDINRREWLMLSMLGILAILFGVLPNIILQPAANTVSEFVSFALTTGKEKLEIILTTRY